VAHALVPVETALLRRRAAPWILVPGSLPCRSRERERGAACERVTRLRGCDGVLLWVGPTAPTENDAQALRRS